MSERGKYIHIVEKYC